MLDDISPIGRSGSKIKVTISKTNIMDAPSVQTRKWNWLVADDISMDADLLVGRAQAPRLLVGAQPMFDRQLDTIRHGDVIAICFDDQFAVSQVKSSAEVADDPLVLLIPVDDELMRSCVVILDFLQYLPSPVSGTVIGNDDFQR